MSVLSLLTDFGEQDGFVGVMKGVIWEICPAVQIADISHRIQPQNVLQGAMTLWRVAPYFGAGTVHVAVVDPGVGTARRAIAAEIGNQRYVAPDNGLLTPLMQDAEEKRLPLNFVEANNPAYWRHPVSNTFHGRDIFAPVGAHLAAGVPLEKIGAPIDNPILLDLLQAKQTACGWQAQITFIDIFGNIRTNLPTEKLTGKIAVEILGERVEGVVRSYGEKKAGALVALADSGGFLEVAEVNGNAAKRLGAKVGDLVEVVEEWEE